VNQSQIAISLLVIFLVGCSGNANASCGEITSRLITLESVTTGLQDCSSLSDEKSIPEVNSPDYSADLYGTTPKRECEQSNSQITFQAEAAFSTFAQNHWMKVGDEDLKYALRELGEGKNEGANYSALLARCL
jgi:hypothetical protein